MIKMIILVVLLKFTAPADDFIPTFFTSCRFSAHRQTQNKISVASNKDRFR